MTRRIEGVVLDEECCRGWAREEVDEWGDVDGEGASDGWTDHVCVT